MSCEEAKQPAQPSRREVLRKGARLAALGGLAIIGGRLFFQSDACINYSICDSCQIFKSGCVLPPAIAKRQVKDLPKSNQASRGSSAKRDSSLGRQH